MNEFLTAACILTGSVFILIAAIGLVRLPDLLCRSHAVAKAMTLGLFLLLIALWLHVGEKQTALKIVLAIFFQLITIPISSHLLGLLALNKNISRWRNRPMDDHRATPPPAPPA
jgi:multicomponent Na+:H+ antiporter subunit G